MGNIICKTCKEENPEVDFHCKGLRAASALCKKCFKKKALEYQRAWNKKTGAKERRKKYNQNPKGKEARRVWAQSEKGVEYNRTYAQKPERREYHKLYSKKPETREKDRLYKQSQSGKEMIKRNAMKPERKKHQKKYMQIPEVMKRLNGYKRQRTRDADDSYVKELIYKRVNGALKTCEIPTKLIELQRQSLILKRTIKQKQKEYEQHSTTKI